jgi:hypothetical protein
VTVTTFDKSECSSDRDDREVVTNLEALCGSGVAILHAFVLCRVGTRCMLRTRSLRSFSPDQLMLLSEGSEAWLIHDIRIDHQSRLANDAALAAGFIPGSFNLAVGAVEAGTNVELEVEYIGDAEDGAAFYAAISGLTEEGYRETLPINSEGVNIRAYSERALIDFGDSMCEIRSHQGGMTRAFVTRDRDEIDADIESAAMDDATVTRPAEPLMVSLRIASLDDRHVMFGVDERTGAVVFEVRGSGRFYAVCNLNGYVPTWWDEFQRGRV